MYDKRKIDNLFKEYVETGGDKTFEQLVIECLPLFGAIIARFSSVLPYREDILQDLLLIFLKQFRGMCADDNLRIRERLEKYFPNPTNYLFLWCRRYVPNIAKKYVQDEIEENIEIVLSDENIGSNDRTILPRETNDPCSQYEAKESKKLWVEDQLKKLVLLGTLKNDKDFEKARIYLCEQVDVFEDEE